jgi:hypothetical protein
MERAKGRGGGHKALFLKGSDGKIYTLSCDDEEKEWMGDTDE